MNLSSDQLILWQHGFVKLNGTIVITWGLMIVMSLGAKLLTRKLATTGDISRWQATLEIIVTGILKQIKDVGLSESERYLPFLGTLFLFIALSSLCTIIPGFQPPTGSLSTTAALALCVFVGVPLFGVREQGLIGYLRSYSKPTFIMLPNRRTARASVRESSLMILKGNMRNVGLE